MSQKKYSLFHLQGGFGKHVAATAVAKCIKNNFPSRELIVTGVWVEIYQNLPFVDRVYQHGGIQVIIIKLMLRVWIHWSLRMNHTLQLTM